jgi:putative transposase
MRKQFNRDKHTLCVDRETGEVWWPAISKEAFADGVRGAMQAYDNWTGSRAGARGGKRMGFPRSKRKGRDADRYTVTTGTMGVEPDHRHLKLPLLGLVKTGENTRKLERLIRLGRARILKITVKRHGRRVIAIINVTCIRPQQIAQPLLPGSQVGIDVGVRRLATVADPQGNILEIIENPRTLDQYLGLLRHLNKEKSRRHPGSHRHTHTVHQISRLQAKIADCRQDYLHKTTTRLAKTHGRIVVEGADVAGMMQQKGLNGARTRRRNLGDAALAEPRRQLKYKCPRYSSELIIADRLFPSTQLCHNCGLQTPVGWAEHWECPGCHTRHQRDDNAAVNLARYPESEWLANHSSSAGGLVESSSKRGAVRKTGPGSAAGCEAQNSNPVMGTEGSR